MVDAQLFLQSQLVPHIYYMLSQPQNSSFIKTAYLTQNAWTVNHHCQDNYGVALNHTITCRSYTRQNADLIFPASYHGWNREHKGAIKITA